MGGIAMDPDVLDVEGAADLFGVSPATIRAEAREGRLPGRRLGRHWRFSRPALLDWLAAPVDVDDEPLSAEDIAAIEQARAEIARGEYVTLDELDRRLAESRAAKRDSA
jgi:excisionase family DNA binding protein